MQVWWEVEIMSCEPTSAFCVFLAEDDLELRCLMADLLRRDGHVVFESSSGEIMLFHLVHLALQRRYDLQTESLIICDIRMPGCGGLAVLRNLREHDAHCPPFIFMTAFPDAATREEAHSLGALKVFEKPFELGELRQLVRDRAAAGQAHSQRVEGNDSVFANVAPPLLSR
jgi:CheY-like chemotaxis protein